MTSLRSRDGEVSFLASLILFYSAVGAIYLVAPIAREFGHVLLGSKLIPFDPFLASAILEWGFRSLFSSSRRFFEWNAGFPVHKSLAVTENLVGWQVLYYPLRLLGIGVPAAYNIVLLISLVVSGIGAACLARRLGAGRWGSVTAGLIFGYGPFHLNNLMNIHTMAVCWAPFAIFFLDRYMERPNTTDGFGLAAAFVLTTLSSIYFGVFLALVLPVYMLLAWIFGRHQPSRKTLGSLLRVGAIAALVVSPIAIPYLQFARENGRYGASVVQLTKLSMNWLAPVRTPFFQVAWSASPLSWGIKWDGKPAFIGLIGLALVIAGLFEYRRGNRVRSTVLTLFSLSLISYLLALGPYFKTAGHGPTRIIDWVPMPGRLWLFTPGIRTPARIFFFAWLGEAILAGLGLSAILCRIQSRWRDAIAAFVILLLLAEYRPARWLAGESVNASSPLAMSDAYPFLAWETDKGGVIELPTIDSLGRRLDLGPYIYGAAGHLRREVAYYGNRKLPVVDSLREAGERVAQESQRGFLANHGVTRVVLHRFLGESAANERLIAALTAAPLPLLFNGRESAVFALFPAPQSH